MSEQGTFLERVRGCVMDDGLHRRLAYVLVAAAITAGIATGAIWVGPPSRP